MQHQPSSSGTHRHEPRRFLTITLRLQPTTTVQKIIVLLALLFGTINNAVAIQWTLDPRLGIGSTFRETDRDTSSPKYKGFQNSLSPSVNISAISQRLRVDGIARYNFNRFSSSDGGDEDNRLLLLNSSYQTARQRWAISGELRNSNTLVDVAEETGILFDETTRKNKALRPSWQWNINGKNNLSVDLYTTKTSYDNVSSTNVRDFNTQGASITFSHQYSGRTSLYGVLSSSFFEFEDDARESTTVSANIGLEHNYSHRWNFGISLGQRATTTISRAPLLVGIFVDPTDPTSFLAFGTVLVELETDDSGATYSSNINYTGNRLHAVLNATRSTRIDATQGQVISDRIFLDIRHKFSVRWTGLATVGYNRSENTSDINSGQNRSTASGQVGLSWQPTPRITVAGRFAYSKQKPIDNSIADKVTRINPSLSVDWKYSRVWRLTGSYRFYNPDSDSTGLSENTHSLGLTVIRSWPTMRFSH